MDLFKNFIRQVLETRPFAQALVLTWLVIALTWAIPAMLLPSVVHLNLGFSEVPDSQAAAAAADSRTPIALGDRYPNCFWTSEPPISLSEQEISASTHHAYCLQGEPRESGHDDQSALNPFVRFQQEDNWQISYHIISTDGIQFGWVAYLSLLIPALAAFMLLYKLPIREDLLRAGKVLLKRPWLLALLPTLMFLSLLLASLFPSVSNDLPDTPLIALFEHLPFLVGYVMIMAVFEEAAFRQFAYKRTLGRLPIWAIAACSAWFFMLAHLFNPQAKTVPGYLFAMLLMGLLLFWMRHRFNSLSLAVMAHAGNNLFFILAALVLSKLWPA
jgi:membrane protease YdiL (CAAX protease family)